MKKILIVLAIVIAVILGAIQLIPRQAGAKSAAQLAPADSVLFLEFPDLPRTAIRWQESPIGQMLTDPDLRLFFQRPLLAVLNEEGWIEARSLLEELQTHQLFLAANLPESGPPQILVGFRAAGGESAVQTALQRLHEEITCLGGSPAEPWASESATGLRQTFKDSKLWTGMIGDWGFLANSESCAFDFVARTQGRNSAPVLADSENFTRTLDALNTKQPDALVFTAPAMVMQQVREIAIAAGAQPIGPQFAKLEQWETLAFAVEFSPQGVMEKAVALSGEEMPVISSLDLRDFGVEFAPADTLLFTSLVLEPSESLEALWPSIPQDLLQALSFSGVDPSALAGSIGEKMSIMLWWPGGSLLPSALGVMEVTDARAFGASAGKLGGLLAGEATVDTSGNLTTMSFRADALGLISPTVAYAGDLGFIALNPGDLGRALATRQSGDGLTETELWKNASPFLSKGNIQLTLVDVPGIVRRAYATFQPMLGFAAALNPQISQYADLSQLPEVDVLVRHLGPVLAHRETIAGGGVRTEITGPVTWSSLLLAIPAGLSDGFSFLRSVTEEE